MDKILAAIQVGMGLIQSGVQIYQLVAGKSNLTDDELNALIDAQDQAQAVARQKLTDLLGT